MYMYMNMVGKAYHQRQEIEQLLPAAKNSVINFRSNQVPDT